MNQHIFSCREAKQKDLVEYLDSLGHRPQKIHGNDYWYVSPFREEKTPSFKVNRKFNIWYDHGMGKGGNLIDFGILYHHCSVRELLQKLSNPSSFQQLNTLAGIKSQQPESMPPPIKMQLPESSEEEKGRIKILSAGEIMAPALVHYLTTRKIPVDLASEYCKQVDFELYGKRIIALGFPNKSGGYELRNPNFKGSSSPKDVSFFDNGRDQVTVFEGFFSFLSFQKINQRQDPVLTNFLVLNSLSFLEKSKAMMERHDHIDLFLDRDPAGIRYTEKALQWDSKYQDQSDFYNGHKDLNEWLTKNIEPPRQSQRQGRHL
jgi:CHC2 zinc finger/Toprim-like